jgi:DNA-binding MarR family transcriptional regulator
MPPPFPPAPPHIARTRHLHLPAFLPYRLSVAANAVSTLLAQIYEKPFSLKVTEWRTMAALVACGPCSQREIGRTIKMDKLAVSRAVAALAARGLIDRKANPADQRAQLIQLTAQGHALYERIAPAVLACEAQLLADFTPSEQEALATLLDRLDATATRLATEPHALA